MERMRSVMEKLHCNRYFPSRNGHTLFPIAHQNNILYCDYIVGYVGDVFRVFLTLYRLSDVYVLFFLSLFVSFSFSILFVLHQKDREIHSLAYLLLLTFSIIFSAYMFFLFILLLFHLHQLLLLVSSIAEVDNETRNGCNNR